MEVEFLKMMRPAYALNKGNANVRNSKSVERTPPSKIPDEAGIGLTTGVNREKLRDVVNLTIKMKARELESLENTRLGSATGTQNANELDMLDDTHWMPARQLGSRRRAIDDRECSHIVRMTKT
jgi:hypothetical protein